MEYGRRHLVTSAFVSDLVMHLVTRWGVLKVGFTVHTCFPVPTLFFFFPGEEKNGSCTVTLALLQEYKVATVLKDSLEAYIEIKYLLKLQFFRVQKFFWNFYRGDVRVKYFTLLYLTERQSVRGGILRLWGRHNKALAIARFCLFRRHSWILSASNAA